MSRLFPSILQDSDDAYTPLDGEEDEEISDTYEQDSTDGDAEKED